MLLPATLGALIAEAFAIRSWMFHVVNGGLSAAVSLVSIGGFDKTYESERRAADRGRRRHRRRLRLLGRRRLERRLLEAGVRAAPQPLPEVLRAAGSAADPLGPSVANVVAPEQKNIAGP